MAARVKTSANQNNKTLFYLALALLIVSAVFFLFNLSKVVNMTGHASVGYINLTVDYYTSVNFTTDTINWANGSVTPGNNNATLNTAINNAANVSRGNWTGNTAGLSLANIGTVNVSLDLASGKTATTFIGGTDPKYEINVSNNKSNSCYNFSTNFWQIFNTTNSSYRVCNNLTFYTTSNEVRIDVRVVIPSDAPAGKKTDTITATVAAS